ncbi:GNAT family N-acetyltransferase [Nocardia cyriacigeorgica]|uniref:GNAT family N-acetyltransferase n=1 Tax=Nocardia cyriacigeorgica TaxID=135487 RepID=UPI0013D74A95|nr:GNAT family N-acetyltransferase [Nocardia cyriacigeorgica]NEW27656.1 GNAT family N-acetyltransferase [Nocardia cyriacigeorgica]
MPELVVPAVRWRSGWLEAHAEWGPGVHEDGFGLRPSDDVESATGFAAWVQRLLDESSGVMPAAARCTYRWIVDDDRVLGGIALRHGGEDDVLRVGHIGYGIRPSARGRGLTTWALGRMLDEARGLGMGRVLVICAAGNVASAKTIERCGGVLEAIEETELGPARRYRIALDRLRV